MTNTIQIKDEIKDEIKSLIIYSTIFNYTKSKEECKKYILGLDILYESNNTPSKKYAFYTNINDFKSQLFRKEFENTCQEKFGVNYHVLKKNLGTFMIEGDYQDWFVNSKYKQVTVNDIEYIVSYTHSIF